MKELHPKDKIIEIRGLGFFYAGAVRRKGKIRND
jgi:hypothetical protein